MKDVLLLGAALYAFYQWRNGWPVLHPTTNALTASANNTAATSTNPHGNPATIPVQGNSVVTVPVDLGGLGGSIDLPKVGDAANLYNNVAAHPDLGEMAWQFADDIWSIPIGGNPSNDPRYKPGVINVGDDGGSSGAADAALNLLFGHNATA